MSGPVVCDASALVAVLLDSGPDGRWVTDALTGAALVAPSLLPYEVTNVVRRQAERGATSTDQAAQAHADLLDLAIEYWPYETLAGRAWELRSALTTYDASYVALAEMIDAPLVTLDRRIAGAPGTRCRIETPG